MTDPGHTPAEGYAASLRQQAEWIIEITGRVRQHSLDPSDIDTDELKAAAAFIEQQAARIAELESQVETLTGLLDANADVLAKAARTQAFKEAAEVANETIGKYRACGNDEVAAFDLGCKRVANEILALDTAPTEQNKGEKA